MDLNWLDITAIVLIVFCALEGLFKGFVISLLNTVGFFAAIYIGKVMAAPFSEYISKNTGIDEALNKYFISKMPKLNFPASYVLKASESSSGQTIELLSSILLLIISFFIIFLIVRFGIFLIAGVLDTAATIPVINQFNRLGGFLFGALKGAAILYIIFAVLTPLIPLLPSSAGFIKTLDKSIFAVNFYRYNLIIPWIRGYN